MNNADLIDPNVLINLLQNVNPQILGKMAQEINTQQATPQNTGALVPSQAVGDSSMSGPAQIIATGRRSGYNGVPIQMQRMRSRLYSQPSNG